MNESPPDTETTPENSRKGRLVNNILVVALVVVGVLGSAGMLYELYGPQTKPAPSSKKESGTAPSASSVAAGSKTGFALRLQAFSNVANAEDLRAKLDALQIPSTLSVEAHVQVGPFRTQQELNAARAKLKELGIYGGEPVTIK